MKKCVNWWIVRDRWFFPEWENNQKIKKAFAVSEGRVAYGHASLASLGPGARFSSI